MWVSLSSIDSDRCDGLADFFFKFDEKTFLNSQKYLKIAIKVLKN